VRFCVEKGADRATRSTVLLQPVGLLEPSKRPVLCVERRTDGKLTTHRRRGAQCGPNGLGLHRRWLEGGTIPFRRKAEGIAVRLGRLAQDARQGRRPASGRSPPTRQQAG